MNDTPTEPDIRQQVNDLLVKAVSAGRYQDPNYLDILTESEDEIIALISQTVNNYIIGADEPAEFDYGFAKPDTKHRNQLRADQRATAKRLLWNETNTPEHHL